MIVCCPPIAVHAARHVAHHVGWHAKKVLPYLHHAHRALRVANMLVGVACVSCPATALISPVPIHPTMPFQGGVPLGARADEQSPGAVVRGAELSGMPPAWGLAAAEVGLTSPKPPFSYDVLAGATENHGPVTGPTGSVEHVPPNGAGVPTVPVADVPPTEVSTFPVVDVPPTGIPTVPVHEPAALLVLAIGLIGIFYVKRGGRSARQIATGDRRSSWEARQVLT
jgi:hypothetical protein